jgi:hypothetical protein
MEQLSVAKDVGLGGAKTSQNRGGLQGIIDHVTAQVAKAVPHLPRSLQVKLAAIGLVGLGVLTEAQGQVVLIDPINLVDGARSQRSNFVDVSDIGAAPRNFHGRKFSITGEAHRLEELRIRGMFAHGPDGSSTYYDPNDDRIRHFAVAIYEIDADGNISSPIAPLLYQRFGPNDVSVTSTGKVDGQGFEYSDFRMNFREVELSAGNYLMVVGAEGSQMTFQGILPTLRVPIVTTFEGDPTGSWRNATNWNNGQWGQLFLDGQYYRGDVTLTGLPVPEPSGLAVLGFGLALLIKRRRN